MEKLMEQWINLTHNKSKSKKGHPAWNKGLTGKNYTNHYKNGMKNQYTGGIVCGQL